MAIHIRKDGSLFLPTVVDAYAALADSALTTEVHRDKTAKQTGTSITPASTLITISAVVMTEDGYINAVNDIRGVLGLHFADGSAHEIADIVNVGFEDGYAVASTLATAYLLANAMKLNYNNHGAETDVHVNNDSSHDLTSPDASSVASLATLVLEMRTDINAHIADAGTTQRYLLVPA